MNVTKLRFPEFRNAGEWKKKKLGDISEIVRGGSPRPIDGYITSESNGLNWLKIGDVEKEAKYVTTTQEKVTPNALNKTRVAYPGDLILSNSMSFGRPYILKIQTCIHDGWIAITKIESSFERDYLYYLIFSPTSQSYFTNNAAGSGVLNLNADIIKLLPIYIPSLPEQQKIADCLSSLDDLIAAHNQKLAALKLHKKSLMQQLFPAEGETVPRLRFPEFRDAEEWEEKRFGDICKFVRGPFGGALTKDIFVNDGYAVYEQSHAIYSDFTSFRYFITSDKYNELKRFAVESNDIIMSCSGTMGRFSIIPPKFRAGIINQALLKLTVKVDADIPFIKMILELPLNQDNLLSQSAGGAIKNVVGVDQMKDLVFMLPSLPEQQKIADYLSSLDELIAAQNHKIEALKTHKKGLMQQLFPVVDEAQA